MWENTEYERIFMRLNKVYLTRKNLEIAALVVIILSAFAGFLFSHSGRGVLTLDKGGDPLRRKFGPWQDEWQGNRHL